jgi:hypothetical protein
MSPRGVAPERMPKARGDGAGSGESADPSRSKQLRRGVFEFYDYPVKLLSRGLGRINARDCRAGLARLSF